MFKNTDERGPLEDVGLDIRIILKWKLKKRTENRSLDIYRVSQEERT